MAKIVLLRNCLQFYSKLYKTPIKPLFIQGLVQRQKFQTCSVFYQRSFIHHENDFAHSVLRNNDYYSVLRDEQNIENNSVIIQDINFNENWKELSLDELLKYLKSIGVYCQTHGLLISDEKFDKFIDACTERCFDFTDDQLLRALQTLTYYPETERPRSRNYLELWSALDDACVERIPKWDLDKILYVCDHWHALNLARISKFNFQSIVKIGRKIKSMQPHHMVQVMFYSNLLRKPMFDMIEAETNILKSIHKLSLDEIAIISVAFFKLETTIKNVDLITKIFQRLTNEIDTVQDIPLVCILKVLKYSSKLDHLSVMKQLLDAASEQIPRLNLLSCLYLALLGTHLQICHQKDLETISQRFAKDLKSTRLKDMERISFVLALFDFESESRIEDELLKKILDELRNRKDEIIKFPQSLPFCLHYLTMKGLYDEELISICLSRPFLKWAYGTRLNLGRHIFALDAYAQINLKDSYKGNFLRERNRQYMGKMLSQYIPSRTDKHKLSRTDEELLEMKETAEELYNHCYLAQALPHFDRPDLIIAYDKTTETGIDISHNFPAHYCGKVIDRAMLIKDVNVNSSDVTIFNFMIGGHNNYVRFSNKPNGLIKLKIEQSKILGFQPVLIPWSDWKKLHGDERHIYIKLKVSNALQQKPFIC